MPSDTEPANNRAHKLAKSHGLRTLVIRVARIVLRLWVWCSVVTLAAWATGAIYYLDYLPKPIGVLLAVTFSLGSVMILIRSSDKRKALGLIAAGIVVVYGLWVFVRPQQDRNWAQDQSRLASVTINQSAPINADVVTIKHFRHANYRTDSDMDVAWQDFTFKLDQIESVWYLVQRFSAVDGLAHTFLSFAIRDGDELRYAAVSVEIRREQDEYFSPLLGIFKRYEITYVVGDERDLIGVRTNVRENDKVFLYRTNATQTDAQNMFRSIASRIAELNRRPEFYHTLLNNCTNNLVSHMNEATPANVSAYQLQVVLPGYSDRIAFQCGLIGNDSESFAELQQRSRIDQLAKQSGLGPDFSNAIRLHKPND